MGSSHSHILTTALNCPPAVVREVGQKLNLKYSQEYQFPPPTDGPPVKHVYHFGKEHHQKAHCCWSCGNEVGSFLSEVFLEQESVPKAPKHPVKRKLTTNTTMRGSSLRYKDVLIVFECSFEDNDNFLDALRLWNIPVRTLTIENNQVVYIDDDKTAYAISVSAMQMYRPKRKIVVYVEMDEQLDSSEYKEIALASCTSQLILVHCKKT
ncbi:uncharacterized protein LOC112576344 [Pomacea canaliculata]|uniref:uncharacterized protein LOC112576344 n=1 Tax=Pomacea canaliculata TaxID=400727 RepID=UPI000D728812|nr:uncharacterized protein LOC112576344 [Pomacea canaliculata]